jgi:hypothetical protein
MEYQTPNTPRTDLPITVESGEPQHPASDSRRPRAAACRHRLRWRDLAFTIKFRLVPLVFFSVAALAVALGCLIDGGDVLRAGLGSSDGLLILHGGVELALFPLLSVGPIAYLRVWRSPHRPGAAATWSHIFASFVLVLLLVLAADGREWMLLLAFPAYMVGVELLRLRSVLTERSTCVTDPTMPKALRMHTTEGEKWPVTDEHRARVFGPRVVEPGFDSWRCPHALFWDDLRWKAKLEWMAWTAGEILYWMGLMLTFSAMFVHDDRLIAASPIHLPSAAPLIGVGVFAYLLQVGNRAIRSGGPLLHRGDTVLFVYGTAGHLLVAALAAVMELELDRPYFWAVTVLALIRAYLVVDLWVTQTPRSRCAAEPEMHRTAQASLKPGRGAPF